MTSIQVTGSWAGAKDAAPTVLPRNLRGAVHALCGPEPLLIDGDGEGVGGGIQG